MLLRSLTKHVKDQNWLAVWIDFAIVVIGVFIGIQVANWNDFLNERSIERELLQRLYKDFQLSVTGIDRDIRFLEQQVSDQRVVIEFLDSCSVDAGMEDVFQRGLATLGFLNPPRLYRRTIDEISASGRTDIIQNRTIAEELDQIVALVEWRTWAYGSLQASMKSTTDEIRRQLRHTLETAYENPFVKDFKGGVDYDIQTLCQNPETANAISGISFDTLERIEAYRQIRARYNEFVPLIARELKARWNMAVAER
ncbi:hypothetical protein R0135_01105 [Congregibacter variabilis]|uniref:Uncharacterized protein n=1 Tax=Congregibacter variabilis TaxID=3081200 RepID=A0ABZ0I5M0_9GAMM|nr:hypothetical protein R0135_01105 [Congregibacter sp. IMCC43200]